jgi:hypothetical protein
VGKRKGEQYDAKPHVSCPLWYPKATVSRWPHNNMGLTLTFCKGHANRVLAKPFFFFNFKINCLKLIFLDVFYFIKVARTIFLDMKIVYVYYWWRRILGWGDWLGPWSPQFQKKYLQFFFFLIPVSPIFFLCFGPPFFYLAPSLIIDTSMTVNLFDDSIETCLK